MLEDMSVTEFVTFTPDTIRTGSLAPQLAHSHVLHNAPLLQRAPDVEKQPDYVGMNFMNPFSEASVGVPRHA